VIDPLLAFERIVAELRRARSHVHIAGWYVSLRDAGSVRRRREGRPHLSRRTRRLMGPVTGLLVDG
jgi:hypothetical protein